MNRIFIESESPVTVNFSKYELRLLQDMTCYSKLWTQVWKESKQNIIRLNKKDNSWQNFW